MTDTELDRVLDVVTFRHRARRRGPFNYLAGGDTPKLRVAIDPRRRASIRRRLERRARDRGLDVFVIYRGGRAKALDIMVVAEKGAP